MLKLLAPIALLTATSATAQMQSPCPAGTVEGVVRVSKLTPTGTMEGFKAANADHAAWYKANNNAALIFVAPVLDMVASQPPVVSTTQIMSARIGGSYVAPAKRDAAWAAYVAKYQANSTMVSETFGCFPALR